MSDVELHERMARNLVRDVLPTIEDQAVATGISAGELTLHFSYRLTVEAMRLLKEERERK